MSQPVFATRPADYLRDADHAFGQELRTTILAEPRHGTPELRVRHAMRLIHQHVNDTLRIATAMLPPSEDDDA